MKKVALVITGHIRTFKQSYKDLKRFILDRHEVDIYFSTWDHNMLGGVAGNSLSKFNPDHTKKLLSEYPNVKDITISNYGEINKTSEKYISSYGEFGLCEDPTYKKYRGGRTQRKTMPYNAGQWYPVQEGFKAIQNPEQYDVLMRSRFDIQYYKPIDFLPNEIVGVHPGPKRMPDTNQPYTELFNIRNHVFYGTPYLVEVMKDVYNKNLETMCKYCNLATDSLLEYILRNNDKGYPLTIDENFKQGVHYEVWK